MAFAPGCLLWRTVWRSFPWSQLCKISENVRWGCPCQVCHSSALPALWEPRFAAKCCAMLALQEHFNYTMMAFAPGCVLWPNVGGVFLGRNFAKSQKMRDRGACPCQSCHTSALPALWEPQFGAKYCAMFPLQVYFN